MRETVSKIITTHKEVKELVKACKVTKYFCYDFETNGVPMYNEAFKPTVISISFQPGFGVTIPLDHFQTLEFCEEGWNWKKELKYLADKLLSNKDIIKVAWNAKYDNQIWEKYNHYYRGTLIDGMLAKYMLDELRPNGLKDMVRRYMPELGNYEKRDAFDKVSWDKKELEPLSKYGAQDTDYTLRLSIFFEKKLIEKGLYDTFRNLIMTASRVLTTVEKNGLYVDKEFNQYLLETYKPKIEEADRIIRNLKRVKKFEKAYIEEKVEKYINDLQEKIDSLDEDNPKDIRKISYNQQKISNIRAGLFTTKSEQKIIEPINLNSIKDLTQLLFLHPKGFKFDILDYTEKGSPSASEDTLVNLRLAIQDPESPKAIFLDRLLEKRGLEKMYTTYIEGWHEKVQDDSRLHGKLNIIGTDSGRLCIASDSSILTDQGLLNIGKLIPNEEGVLDISDLGIHTLTHLGNWKLITHAINKGYEEMYEVTLANGNSIRCTLGHKFVTNNGIKALKDIDYETDEIICE